ncbi:MAG: hypothetical protein GY816_20935 [Cytophagales bacterium]|nr:hypothetical protein [Cytophagales bacterium]
MIRTVLTCLVILFLGITLKAQEPAETVGDVFDSLVYDEDHIELFTEISDLNPKRSAILSAVLPGLGQVYNRQYWKVPLIIGGGVMLSHYIKYHDRLYNSFRSAFIAESDADIRTINPFTGLNSETLQANVDQLRRDRDNLMIMTTLFYVLNIIDAHISAHLHEFQINDALSMDIQPAIQPSALISRSVGISFSFKF